MLDFKQLEIELNRAMVQVLILEAIGFAIAMWVLYLVIKYAIRDGINESNLGRAALRPSSRGPSEPEAWEHHTEAMKVREAAKKMPPIRAD